MADDPMGCRSHTLCRSSRTLPLGWTTSRWTTWSAATSSCPQPQEEQGPLVPASVGEAVEGVGAAKMSTWEH